MHDESRQFKGHRIASLERPVLHKRHDLTMRLLSWNINGIRAAQKKGFLRFVHDEKPDILCLQETKAAGDSLLLPGYAQFWNNGQRKGYAGTALLSKTPPLAVSYGKDVEGRVITAEYAAFYLVCVYTPNSGRGLPRHAHRQEWDKTFLKFLTGLDRMKPVILAGDLNVAHKEIDLANPKQNVRNAGFTIEERNGFQALLDAGFVDSFRHTHKEHGNYTYWGMWNNLRQRNIGWRIDYVLLSRRLLPMLNEAFILKDVTGSDHCPVGVIVDVES